jgi:hypothetical protein
LQSLKVWKGSTPVFFFDSFLSHALEINLRTADHPSGRFIERGVRLPWLQVRHARPPLALLRHPPVLNSDQTAK